MIRTVASLVVLALAMLLSACCPEDPFVPTPLNVDTVRNPAFLRIVHAAADAPAAAPMLGGTQFKPALPYMTYRSGVNEAKYYPADTSAKTIAFVGDGRMLASAPIELVEGAYYTAYLHGKEPNYRVLVTRDTVAPPPGVGQLKVRIVNLAPDSPPLDISFTTSPGDPVARSLAYGSASPYSLRSGADLNLPGINVVASGTTDTLFRYPEGVLPLVGEAIMTLVVSGEIVPSGDAPLLAFAAFFDHIRAGEDNLYGSLPFPLRLTAIRLVNIVAQPTFVGLDLAFFDRDFQRRFNNLNQGYRRNYRNHDSVRNAATLADPSHRQKGYYLFPAGELSGYRYRLEKFSIPHNGNEDQLRVSDDDTVTMRANQRYTFVAYGTYTETAPYGIRTTELHDNTPTPSSMAVARLRLFHGSVTHAGSRIRLRVGTATGPAMGYGEAPDGSQSFEVPAGSSVRIEAVDESGTVIHASEHQIIGGKAYTVFLAPQVNTAGTIIGVLLRPLADELSR